MRTWIFQWYVRLVLYGGSVCLVEQQDYIVLDNKVKHSIIQHAIRKILLTFHFKLWTLQENVTRNYAEPCFAVVASILHVHVSPPSHFLCHVGSSIKVPLAQKPVCQLLNRKMSQGKNCQFCCKHKQIQIVKENMVVCTTKFNMSSSHSQTQISKVM